MRILFWVWIGVFGAYNETCNAPEQATKCENGCIRSGEDCFLSCSGDSSCISTCVREYDQCLQGCPCHEKCPDGCPCDTFKCNTQPNIIFIIADDMGRDTIVGCRLSNSCEHPYLRNRRCPME